MWGIYGIFLHKGQVAISPTDPSNAGFKAFLFVGGAYFLIGVLAPLAMLLIRGADWKMTGGGMTWSLVAGVAGAIGAFGVIMAFSSKGSPSVVMSLIFAGAPLVNAAVAITLAKQWSQIQPLFVIGILLAAIGGYMIVKFKPAPVAHPKPAAAQVEPTKHA